MDDFFVVFRWDFNVFGSIKSIDILLEKCSLVVAHFVK